MSEQIFVPAVAYRDRKAAMDFLEQAFGFEVSLLVTDTAGEIGHAEMTFAGARIAISGEWGDPALIGPATVRSPAGLGGANTGFLRIQMADGVDAHCRRARAAGATITQEPGDQFYGERNYRCLDPEGHIWTFGQPVANPPTLEQMEAASGFKLTGKEG